MRSAIDILQQAFRVHTGSFVADPTRRNPAEELQTWLAKQKAADGGGKPSSDCLKSAAKAFFGTDIETLLFRYERCLPYLLEKNMMAHPKTGLLLGYCANHPPTNLRFWRGLVSMYFSFDQDGYPNGIENWRKTQQLISVKLDFLVTQSQGKRDWITYLSAHRDLLTDKPGVQFAEASLRTGQDTTSELKEKLDIPQESWFWTQYLLTKIAVAENSRYFENTISEFITELRKQQFLSVRSEGIKQLLEIYQRKGLGTKEHQGLLEFAVEYWKAPYKNNHADWLRINDATYQMVLGWYTRKRLNEFIDELRGSYHVQDDRLNFWVNYSQAIRGRFFILMGDSFLMNSRFSDIANRYPQNFGRLAGDSSNNAFVFDFGNLYAVVFTEVGNALYFYQKTKNNFPILLVDCNPLIQADKKSIYSPSISTGGLKKQHVVLKRIVQHGDWRLHVGQVLLDYGIYPDRHVNAPTIERSYQQPTPKPTQATPRFQQPSGATTTEQGRTSTLNVIKEKDLDWVKKAKQIANKYNLQTEDNLEKGGNFWILVDQRHASYFDVLRAINDLGFRMKIDKGFWKKEDEPVT